ncbi:MAG: hypothetical protein K2L27_03615 [Muribaculaceae bacterium]|nr:hypothetical protein [Muribaculaceae bacterium]
MTKNIAISLTVAATLAAAVACNTSTDYHTELDGNAAVKAFSLAENDKVLADLDSVYFSIDLVTGDIFNADSLPLGTRLTGIAANITTDGASAVTLYVPRPGKTDSVVDYLQHSADSIDFSNGPVRLEVVSQNGVTKKDYHIRINVHTVVSDSLCWGDRAFADLPGTLSAPVAQHTVSVGSAAYTYTTDGTAYSIAATTDFAAWEPATFAPGFAMDISSIVSSDTDGTLYALDTDGTLHSATRPEGPWTATGATFHSLYGVYGGAVLGCVRHADGTYTVETYPSSNRVINFPAGLPVSGFSPALLLESEMSDKPQMLITGGRRADGLLSADTYGYDGHSWAKLTAAPLPKGFEGVAVAPYYSLRSQAIEWRADILPTLLAFGGRDSQGNVNSIVYMSRDWGMHWQKADSLLQLPPEMPAVYGAQALVAERTLHASRSASAWTELPSLRLPIGARLEHAGSPSRATTLVTEWQAPYIYLFGGTRPDGKLNPTVWRGAINRLTYRPIQ